jgi:hypothetical protein
MLLTPYFMEYFFTMPLASSADKNIAGESLFHHHLPPRTHKVENFHPSFVQRSALHMLQCHYYRICILEMIHLLSADPNHPWLY